MLSAGVRFVSKGVLMSFDIILIRAIFPLLVASLFHVTVSENNSEKSLVRQRL